MHADLILTGGRICPVAHTPLTDGAIAISGSHIMAVGHAPEILHLAGPATRVIRLEPQQALIPGFNDSHQHLLSYVRARSRVPLWDTTSLPQVLERIASIAAVRPAGSWIIAVGHDQGRLAEGRHPTCAELDVVAPNHPVLIYRACSHSAIANTAALALAGVTTATPDPPGGRLERIGDTLTGLLQESAIRLVAQVIGPPAIDWVAGLLAAAGEYHRRGITSIGEAALGHIDGMHDLERLRAAMHAGMRLRTYVMAYGELADWRLAEPQHPDSADSLHAEHWLRFGPIKLMADGTLGGGTAFLTEDYGDEPGNRGWPVVSAEELNEKVEQAHRAGFQVAIHAIGDATVAMALDAYERALLRFPRFDHRHRIEHLEAIHGGLAERMAALGVVAAIQSCFTYWEYGDVTRLGPGLAPWGHAWGALERAGVVLANGSDNPVLPDFVPLQGMYAAVTRKTHAGLLLAPDQAISPAAALRSYTFGGAYAAFEEPVKGTLEPGKLADLVVLSGDPLGRDHEMLREIGVDMTIVGGEIVCQRG